MPQPLQWSRCRPLAWLMRDVLGLNGSQCDLVISQKAKAPETERSGSLHRWSAGALRGSSPRHSGLILSGPPTVAPPRYYGELPFCKIYIVNLITSGWLGVGSQEYTANSLTLLTAGLWYGSVSLSNNNFVALILAET